MSSSISTVELAKDVDGANQMIEEHSERKVSSLCSAVLIANIIKLRRYYCF